MIPRRQAHRHNFWLGDRCIACQQREERIDWPVALIQALWLLGTLVLLYLAIWLVGG